MVIFLTLQQVAHMFHGGLCDSFWWITVQDVRTLVLTALNVNVYVLLPDSYWLRHFLLYGARNFVFDKTKQLCCPASKLVSISSSFIGISMGIFLVLQGLVARVTSPAKAKLFCMSLYQMNSVIQLYIYCTQGITSCGWNGRSANLFTHFS
jgi:hypothetical protein